MPFFQAKMGWERPRKREKKIIVPINSYPSKNWKFKKNSKKIQKIKKHHYDFFSSQNGSVEAEKEKKKKLSFRSFPTQPVIENSKKNNKKNQKIKKHHYGFFSSQNVLGEAEKEKKKKLSFRSIPTRNGIENSKN